MPPDFSDTFGNFMKGADLPPNKEFALTIAGAGIQEFNAMGAATGSNKQRKLVLSFRETTKLLVCNSTNSRTIGDAYGCDSDGLTGRKIRVSRVVTSMGPGVIVRCPPPPAQTVAGDPFAAGSQADGAQPQSRRTVLVDPPQQPGSHSAGAPPATPPPPSTDFDDDIPFN